MAFNYFQRFIEASLPQALSSIDLTQGIADRDGPEVVQVCQKKYSVKLQGKVALAIDGECCLQRLYGGTYSDYACGGDWNRMQKFVDIFVDVASRSNVEFTVFFNGALEPDRMNDWVKEQINKKWRIAGVMKHSFNVGTPPHMHLWVEPSGLRSYLRMLLRLNGVRVVVTSGDHHLEVISHMKEFNFHGLLADHSDYVFFDPPRYFLASQMKLTYRGSIVSKEINLHDVATLLKVPPSRMYLVAALLGNHILTGQDLWKFHLSLCPHMPKMERKDRATNLIRAVVKYVINLESVDDLTKVATKIFGYPDVRCEKFKQCIYFFCQGYQRIEAVFEQPEPEQQEEVQDPADFESDVVEENKENDESVDAEAELSDLMNEVFSKMSADQDGDEQGRVESTEGVASGPSCDMNSQGTNSNGITHQNDKPSTSSANNDGINQRLPIYNAAVRVDPRVLELALERHSRGLMHPYINQILTHREIKLPVILEHDFDRLLPPSTAIYRPLRQMVYGLLFSIRQPNERHEGSSGTVEIMVREWVYDRDNKYREPDLVPAWHLGWPVPVISVLWFRLGQQADKIRMKAFLSCMRCDIPEFYGSGVIPRRFVVLCCVLRYLLAGSRVSFLKRHELDSFLAQAVDPNLRDCDYIETLALKKVAQRGITLASVFMQGVDLAIMANDACGCPVNWELFNPWAFFEGRLFHSYFLKSNLCRNLGELCDYNEIQILMIEQLRNAITQGLLIQFAPSEYNNVAKAARPPGYQGISPDGISPLEAAGVPGYNSYNRRGARINRNMPVKLYIPSIFNRRPTGIPRPRVPSSTSSDSSGKRSSANICLGMGRGAPNPEDSDDYNNLGFQF